MCQVLKQSLQQKLGLKINPLQIQLIKLLELPAYQLEQRIKEELEQNPLLEVEERPEGEASEEQTEDMDSPLDEFGEDGEDERSSEDDFSLEDYMGDDDDIPEYRLATSNASRDDENRDFILSQGASFRESLVAQLGTRPLSESEHRVAEYIIGNIDDDGYLRRDVENIVDDLAFGAGVEVSEEEVLRLLKLIQQFEPAGVGARDLKECLLLQIERKRAAAPDNKILEDAKIIVAECFDEFSRKHYEKISRRLRLNDAELKQAIDEILKLNPTPGGAITDAAFAQHAEKIIPDFSLDLVDGELQLSLNAGDVPELRINKSYLDLLEQYQSGESTKGKKDVVSFVKYKLNSAKSFIDAVHQRNNTLMLTMTAIVQFQKPFFLSGDESMLKPMILKDIADVTGLDVSTISRVSNSKYVQTWFGIYALKDFFSNGMQTVSGEEVSTGELKNMLKTLVDEEDKRKPLTDDELVALMEKKGFQIARRTVAKYRQMLDIPVARLRREI